MYRVRGTYGGNIADFTDLRSTGTADLQTVKLFLNATISEDAFLASGDATTYIWRLSSTVLRTYG